MNLGETGKKGEDMVAAFLRKKGCTVVKRNYTCRFGEIDIIAKTGGLLLFVEVKTRESDALVSPAESVDAKKVNRIRLAANDYLSKKGAETGLQPRFDVAEVTVTQNAEGKTSYSLNYIKNAF